MWSADAAGLQQWSWGEVDSYDTTTGCLSQLSSQMNNPLWHRQGEGGWPDPMVIHQQAEHRDPVGGRKKPAGPTL